MHYQNKTESMSKEEKCIAYFEERGISSREYRGAVYVHIVGGIEVELAEFEKKFRASVYDENQKFKTQTHTL